MAFTRNTFFPALWKRLRFWLDIVAVIRLNGFVLLGAIAVSLFFLAKDEQQLSTFFDRVTFYTTFAALLAIVLAFYLLVVVVPYLWFFLTYYILRKDRNQILFKFLKDSCVLGEAFTIDAILQRKMRLVFGVIKFRLVFYEYDSTDWYFLLKSQRRKGELFNSSDRGAIGSFDLYFRHLGRFRTRYSVVKFEDPFGLLSLPIVEKEFDAHIAERNFYIYSIPSHPVASAAPYYVKRASVPSVSEQKFKVAEDFFDQKRYEPTDDSRRLLWKVFARSRELLIRIPERDSVIDADVEMHILFYNSFSELQPSELRRMFDTYLGDIVRFFEALLRQRSLNISITTDCTADPPYDNDPSLPQEENLKRALVCNDWHQQRTPSHFLQEQAARRTNDREHILLVNPLVAIEDVPHEFLPSYSNVYLLGTDAIERQKPFEVSSLMFVPKTSQPAQLIRNAIHRSLLRRLKMNHLQLAARMKEFH